MQAATESNANMAATAQKSAMKATTRGARPSSTRRKVVISDDPRKNQNPSMTQTMKSMDSQGNNTMKESQDALAGTKKTLDGTGT